MPRLCLARARARPRKCRARARWPCPATVRLAPAHRPADPMRSLDRRRRRHRKRTPPAPSRIGMRPRAQTSEDIPRAYAEDAVLPGMSGNRSAIDLAEFGGEQQVGFGTIDQVGDQGSVTRESRIVVL